MYNTHREYLNNLNSVWEITRRRKIACCTCQIGCVMGRAHGYELMTLSSPYNNVYDLRLFHILHSGDEIRRFVRSGCTERLCAGGAP